jgi:hypothetical protein
MLLIALIVIGLLFLGAVFWVGLAMIGKVEHDQNKAEKNAPALLDATFDGRPSVTFNLNMRTMKYDTVILGAKERGYALTHQAGDLNGAMTLIFDKG